jgi:hypothetical protein
MFKCNYAPYNALSNPFAWAYFGCHGSYGLLWAGKNFFGFGDERFHKKAPLFMQVLTSLALINYWIPIYLICTSTNRPPYWALGLGLCFDVNVSRCFPVL